MDTFKIGRRQFVNRSIETMLALRALFFVGNRYICPCCGWKLSTFTHGGASMRIRPQGYCPRCNSKAHHRRWWLFLYEQTSIFTDRLRLFHVAPNYCMSRCFGTLPIIDYVGVDLNNHRNVCVKMNLPVTPILPETFDAIICMHVLEHILEDRKAMHEMYRILKPDGWVGISVPIRMNQKTYEDPAITSPEERERAFGETVHVRYYGSDIVDRLEGTGFRVKMHPGNEINPLEVEKHGLRTD